MHKPAGAIITGALLLVAWGAPDLVAAAASTGSAIIPLIQAHAHNDYEHARPLLDALAQGFCSVEADIFLVNGELLVAHNLSDVRPERTLRKLYLEPLREQTKANGGKIYPDGPEVSLLIDLKSDWRQTYPVLRSLLEEYRDCVSMFEDGKKTSRAILVIISGNRDKEMFAREKIRYAAYDGEVADLNSAEPSDLVPWISASWGSLFRWRGTGTMPKEEQDRLDALVSRAHAQGKRMRFWGAPDNASFWQTLLAHKVDLINTDNLEGARDFLLQTSGLPGRK